MVRSGEATMAEKLGLSNQRQASKIGKTNYLKINKKRHVAQDNFMQTEEIYVLRTTRRWNKSSGWRKLLFTEGHKLGL